MEKCLNVQKNELFLIITDTETEIIARAIFEEGLRIGAETIITVMKPRAHHGEEPPKAIAELWKNSDVYVAPTQYSLSHTQARKDASQCGARGATMPGITIDIFMEALSTDFNYVKQLNEKLSKLFEGKEKVRITTKMGTDISFSIKGRKFILDNGLLHNKGDFGNLPAGEIYIAPVEGTANGKIIADGSIASIGKLRNPVEVVVKDGYAVEINGGEEAFMFKKILESAETKEAFNIAEFGIGTNPNAKVIGNILEDEKAFHTIHIALGDNSTFGGKVKAGIHLDMVIKNPTVTADNTTIIEEGNFLLS